MIINILLSILFLCCIAHESSASIVTTLSLVEKAGVTTNNHPLTFGHVFKQGDVTSGILVKYNGTSLVTQFDKKTSWSDGSAKFGVVSIVIPTVSANSTGTITIETSTINSSASAMDKVSILGTDVESNIILSNLNGSGYSGSATASLRDQISDGELNYWLQGSVCTEVLENQQINNSLTAVWEARFYPGTSFGIRIASGIDNVSSLSVGNVGYDVAVTLGESAPSQVFTKSGHTQYFGSRWRKVFWLGAEPPETELHYDIDYLISSGMIMPYDKSITISESTIANEYSLYLSKDRTISGSGIAATDFGTTGGRQEIGILPQWGVMWLLTMDNRMRQVTLEQGELMGHAPTVHFIERDNTKTNYNKIMSVDDRQNASWKDPSSWVTPLGSVSIAEWNPDRAHQGSFAYLPYLITGEYWFLQEVYHWGAYSIGRDAYGRNGAGNVQDFSSGHDGSYGIVYDPPRGIAWALRNISDAANVAIDGSSEATYFSSKLSNNINWLLQANTATSHGLHAIRGTREDVYSGQKWSPVVATWMHDFVVLSLSDIIRKKTANVQDTTTLRDRLGLFTIGRVSNHPAMNKWDGTGYVYPLARANGGDYYTNGSWGDYWTDIQTMNVDYSLNQGYPHTSLAHYNYADSYAFIAMAATSQLNTSGASDAYNFYKDALTYENLSVNPTWAISPLATTCGNGIQDGDETGIDCGGSCPACSTPTLLIPTSYRIPGGVPYGIVQ